MINQQNAYQQAGQGLHALAQQQSYPFDWTDNVLFQPERYQPKIEPKKETSMITEVAKDMKAFVKEHKSVIYWIAVLFLIDHFFFEGNFKTKLHDMTNKLIGKVEAKIHKIEA